MGGLARYTPLFRQPENRYCVFSGVGTAYERSAHCYQGSLPPSFKWVRGGYCL